ncbi:MAG: MBL fold metallo-hydrolase [Acidimicrobiia bacterium]
MAHYADEQLEITRVVVGPLDNNVFVARCRHTGRAALVDAADDGPMLVDLCRELGVELVIETHGHADHTRAVPAVREAGLPVWVTAEDAPLLPGYDRLLTDGQVLEVGRLRLQAIHTPGHTPGSICFKVEGSPVLFSGDTLFPGGPGATRGDARRFRQILRSIEERLFVLPDDTHVLPGHGKDTTIGAERPDFEEWAARGW